MRNYNPMASCQCIGIDNRHLARLVLIGDNPKAARAKLVRPATKGHLLCLAKPWFINWGVTPQIVIIR